MSKFFIGSATHKLDAKGRVSLPSDFRDVLRFEGVPDRFVLVPAGEGGDFHTAFTKPGHERLVKRLSKTKFSSDDEEFLTRQRYIWNAKPIAVEDTGRFVLSQELRNQLGLTDQAYFLGDGPTFQIWEPGRFAALDGKHSGAEPKKLNLARMI